MSRVALALVAALLLIAAPSATAQVPPPMPGMGDTDGDGFLDPVDTCPFSPGVAPDGCPGDTDGDKWPDSVDQCPTVAGPIKGCPDPDRDHDGFPNETDRCPDVGGPTKGCFTDPDAPPPADKTPKPTVATQVEVYSAGLKKHGGAFQFSGTILANGVMTPQRLTIVLPKGITVSGAPLKPCSQTFARSMTYNEGKRCAKIFMGRLSDEDISGYYAFAGPKVGARQRLWLRGKNNVLGGFGTGWIEPAKGAFGPTLTLELGQLGIKTRSIELLSLAEAGVKPLQGKCTGKYRVRLESAQGIADKTFRC